MISVIIPTLNEATNLRALLNTLAREEAVHEVIVADGGSTDASVTVAFDHGARVAQATRGRGPQIAAGAGTATGEILLFLHADSVFPTGGLTRIADTLAARPEVVGGNFRVIFDGDDGFSRWLTGAYAWIRRHGLYYGDSGVFVRTDAYGALGGVRPIAVMEDYDFVRRLEKIGPTCCIEDPPLVTSSRRFEGRHPLAIVWGWIKIHALYHLGVSPGWLAALYDSDRRGAGADPD